MPRFSNKKAIRSFQEKIHCNTRYRNKFKRDMLSLQKHALEVADTTTKPIFKEDYERRELQMNFLQIALDGLALVKRADAWSAERKLKQCRYILYKKGRRVVFSCSFFKPSEMKNKTNFFFFPNGLPTFLQKKRYELIKKEFPLHDYKEIDRGTFTQRHIAFDTLKYIFKGTVRLTLFARYIQRDHANTYWASQTNPKSALQIPSGK